MTLILHLGAPKTATSTLQGAFFPRHSGLFFLGKTVDEAMGVTAWRTPELSRLMLALERTNLDFAPDRAEVGALVAGIGTEAAGRPVVISSEDLCLFSAVDPFAKLARVTELFGVLGPVRAVLAVREQLSLLRSIYLTEHRGEMLKLPGTKQGWHPDFDQYLDIHFRYAWGSTLECFRFSAMIDRYEQLLGPANLFVYAFEDFARDPAAILKRLCRFIGVAEDLPFLEDSATNSCEPALFAKDVSLFRPPQPLCAVARPVEIPAARLRRRLPQMGERRRCGRVHTVAAGAAAHRRVLSHRQ